MVIGAKRDSTYIQYFQVIVLEGASLTRQQCSVNFVLMVPSRMRQDRIAVFPALQMPQLIELDV